MGHFVLRGAAGLFLDQGDIGFFVTVIYFAWIAELGCLAGITAIRRKRPFGWVRIGVVVATGSTGLGFLLYRVVAGEVLNWPKIGVWLVAGPLAYCLIARLLEQRRAPTG